MVFSSVTFLFFFLPAFLLCYVLLPFRNATALAFSALFYVWGEGVFAAILVLAVLIDYVAGARLVGAASDRSRKRVLAAAISAHLGLLVYFKYSGFLVTDLLGIEGVDPSRFPHLPLGISFFTFHSISYLVDVYRGAALPARNIWDLALYLMLFPQLIAGPIVRYASIARQIRRRTVHANHVVHGLLFFAVGLSQKVLLANNVAGVADGIFGLGTGSLSSLLAWTGALAYTLQIYFDFAGYSNMAIGLGLFMGFQFPQNFDYPYISQSITEFWRRWHMSLSSWFRDYLYIPLGGNRRGALVTYRNLLVVFLFCGLWHGANWTFVAWGFYHGLLLVLERLGLGRALRAVPRPLRHLYAMGAVIVGWVLFRADSFPQAISFLGQMFRLSPRSPEAPGIWEFVTHQQMVFAALGCVAATPVARALAGRLITDRRSDVARRTAPRHRFGTVADVSFAVVLIAICAVYVASGTYNPFIYFRF
jgi:alginate O-acetyltransferase complex protein AlgI